MDGNGSIDSYEFTCALALMSHGTLDEKAELIFRLYDFDRSQAISKDELTVLMTNTLCSMMAMEKRPAPTIAEIEKKTNAFFAAADADKNNMISLAEFKSYIKKDKEILGCLQDFGIAKKEDLGTDFGNGSTGVPDLDDDLEEECNPKALKNSDAKNAIKSGNQSEFVENLLEGDQFGAVKPWKAVVTASKPTSYKPNARDGEAPDADLSLEYVYGYRCHDARNNLRYTFDDKIVYHCAGVGVVLDKATNTQKFFMDHRDDIHCLAIDASGKLCVSGEIGPKPRICVWDNQTMQCLAMFVAPLTKGIKNVCFSADGTKIAASAMDVDHQIAIFDWKTPAKTGPVKPIAVGNGTKAAILSLAFNPAGTELVATCVKEVIFFTFAGGLLTAKKGTGWTPTAADAVLCQAFVENTLFTGNQGGEIISWSGAAIAKRTKAHTARIDAMFARKGGNLFSGARDGFVCEWAVQGTTVSKVKTYDLNKPEIMSMSPFPQSVCQHANGTVLVGTRGGEILELDKVSGAAKVHVRSHWDGELWGLAIHPTQPEVYTFGRDTMLAIWDLKTHRQKKHCKLEGPGDALAFSNDGRHLAIGFANGNFIVLDTDFKPIIKRGDRAGKQIQVMKYSPDNSILAVGGQDQMIFTYDVKLNYKPMKKLRGHSSRITHIDWLLGQNVLQSNCQAYDHLFFDCNTGKQVTTGASQFKDQTWATWNCIFGWPVQGIFPPAANGTDINMVARSPDASVLATADDFGMVKLFKFPCPVEQAAFKQYNGHSSHVTNIAFTNTQGQNYVVSTGGEDKCIFQWKYTLDRNGFGESQVMKATKCALPNSDIGNDYGDEEDEDQYGAEQQDGEEQQDFGEFGQEEVLGGDERGCMDVFKGQVDHSIPSGFVMKKGMELAPNNNLTLTWAHGFRSFDTRGNLKYTNTGSIAWTTAGVGVVYDKKSNQQSFFNMHKEDIVAMAIHPRGDVIATGQMACKELGPEPSTVKINQGAKNRKELAQGKLVDILIWNAHTKTVMTKIRGFHRRAVRNLAFSPNGSKLLSIGEDDQHSVAVYDWMNNVVLGTAQVDPGKVFDASWNNETTFATCGAKHVKIFTLQGSNLNGMKGAYSQTAGMVMVTSCQYVDGTLYTGTDNGALIKWAGSSAGKPVKAHADAIWCIQKGAGTDFFTGGNDGKIMKWNSKTGAPVAGFCIDLNTIEGFSYQPGLRSMDFKPDVGFLVGTRGSDIAELDTNGNLAQMINQGHFQGCATNPEIWGVASHPSENVFATCGADKTVRLWNPFQMVAVSAQFTHDVTAVDWSSDGTFLALGDRNGSCHVLDAETLEVIGQYDAFNVNKKDSWVEVVKISPDSSMIAFGTHGGCSRVELAKITPQRKVQKFASVNLGLSSALNHMDWSMDGQFIVLNSQANELMWMSVDSKKQVSASAARDIDWYTWTCIFGFPVQGIWPGLDYTNVKTVDRSHSGHILATGDDFGTVKLFQYPCVAPKAQFKEYFGHSSFVTKLKFSHNDQYLFTVGGNDKTVFVWETDLEQGDYSQQIQHAADYDFHPDDPDFEDKRDRAKEEKKALKEKNARLEKAAIRQRFNQEHEQRDFGENGVNMGFGSENYEEGDQMGFGGDQMGFDFGTENVDEGTEFTAVKPWKGQMREPTGFKKAPKNQELPPPVKVELEWVYGYRGSNAKNNLRYLKDGSLAYFAAGLGICYNPATHTQRFMNAHTDDITCIAFAPNGMDCVTGENGAKPVVHVWDGITMQIKHSLKANGIVKSIQNVAYSPSGNRIGIVDQSDSHNVAVYDAATGTCVAQSKGPASKIIEMAFADDNNFVTVGAKHFAAWTIAAGNCKSRLGNFGSFDQRIGSVAFNGPTALTGSVNGDLYLWAGTAISGAPKKLHSRLIDAITVTKAFIFTGGRDGKINVLSPATYAVHMSIDATTWTDCVNTNIRAITLSADSSTLMIGTFGHEIVELPVQLAAKQVGAPRVRIHGHYAPLVQDNNECWGLDVFPTKDKIVTVSDDATLRIWDVVKRVQIKAISMLVDEKGAVCPLNAQTKEHAHTTMGRSVAVHPTGQFIAVGMRDGSLRVYETKTYKITYRKKVSPEWIEDLKYSPDGQYLAVGSHDNKIYLYNVPAMTAHKKIGKSSSFITHLDWSQDSQSLRTTDGSYEILYYSIANGQQITSGATGFRDEPWNTNSCVLGWAMQGVWQEGQDGSDINHADRSNQPIVDGMQLLATADDSGKVNVYRYPSMVERSQPLVCVGHSSHVTKVRFGPDDAHLFSTGGNDTATMQWKIIV